MSQEQLSLRKIREIIRLKYEAGLSNRAIAGACKISNSTVGEYLRRANLPELAGRAGHVPDVAAGEVAVGRPGAGCRAGSAAAGGLERAGTGMGASPPVPGQPGAQ